jgi:hypothetical protein
VVSGRHGPTLGDPAQNAALLAVSAIVYAFVSSPSMNFKPKVDASSPVPRRAVVSAIPANAAATPGRHRCCPGSRMAADLWIGRFLAVTASGDVLAAAPTEIVDIHD